VIHLILNSAAYCPERVEEGRQWRGTQESRLSDWGLIIASGVYGNFCWGLVGSDFLNRKDGVTELEG